MSADLETIVQRMIDAGESEDSIASVIREYRTPADTPTSNNVAGVLAPALTAATRAIPPVADAVASSPLAVRAISTGAGAAIPAVLTAAAHAAGVPGAITGPALAVAELQAGKLGTAIRPFVERTLTALGSTPGRNAATGAFQKVPAAARVLRTAGQLATPLSALGAGAAVNQRLEADIPRLERAILLQQLGIGSRASDIPLPSN
jgi:hypothetical protein